MDSYPLRITTPEGTVYQQDVESIVVPGEQGSFGVLAHHAPMIAAVKNGPLTIHEPGGNTEFYAIGQGVLEVTKDQVLLLSSFGRHKLTLDDAKVHSEDDTDNQD